MSNKLPRKQIYDITGEDRLNDDGSHRQQILQACLPGEPVELVRQPANPHDSNAIYVCLAGTGQGIGFVSRQENEALAAALDAGAIAKARIHELRGGLPDFPNFGCKVCIVAADKPFRNYIGLRPEQAFYEHAPVWRHSLKIGTARAKQKNSTSAKIVRSLFKGLFK